MKRALIELDGRIDDGFCGQYSFWKEKYLPNDSMDSFFTTIVTDAYERKMEVWQAILDNDEIWVDSSYIGDSGRLLVKMLDSADKFKLSNKVLINMNNWVDVAWHIPDDAKILIKRLEANNIKFVYADEIGYQNYLPCKE